MVSVDYWAAAPMQRRRGGRMGQRVRVEGDISLFAERAAEPEQLGRLASAAKPGEQLQAWEIVEVHGPLHQQDGVGVVQAVRVCGGCH